MALKFSQIVEPGVRSGVVVESKYIQGGYKVFRTIEDLTAYTKKYKSVKNSVLIDGTHAYIVDNDICLVYKSTAAENPWQLSTADLLKEELAELAELFASLATVAFTGNITDLTQSDTDAIIFNCNKEISND